MEKLYCAKCGKENTTAGACFCAFCGGELGEKPLPAAEQTAKLCTQLKDTYINYVNWSSEYLAARSAGTILAGMFTGNGDYNNRDEHREFMSRCEDAAAKLLQNFSCPDCDRAAVLLFLDFALFDIHSRCGDEARWMILACEKFYLPFLDLLSAPELESLHSRYKAFRKKRMNLPVQDDMLKRMKQLGKKRK